MAISSASACSLRSGLTRLRPTSAVTPSISSTTIAVAIEVISAVSKAWCWRNWLRATICVASRITTACIPSTIADWSVYQMPGAVAARNPGDSGASCGKMPCGSLLAVASAVVMAAAQLTPGLVVAA